MFDLKIRSELSSLAELLRGVAHPAENTGRTVPTAEVVIERLREERDAWIETARDTAAARDAMVAQRDSARHDRDAVAISLGHERRARTHDRAAYAEALRAAAVARTTADLALISARAELDDVVDLLVARGVMAEPGDGAHVDLVGVIRSMLDAKAATRDRG